MSTSVEEIIEAVRQLPHEERDRLLDLLHRNAKIDDQIDMTNLPSSTEPKDNSRDRMPHSRDVEMHWLLEHSEFCEQHRGEHVALWGSEMIAVGRTRKEVIAEARRRGIKFPLVQYLPKNEEEWLRGFSNQPLT